MPKQSSSAAQQSRYSPYQRNRHAISEPSIDNQSSADDGDLLCDDPAILALCDASQPPQVKTPLGREQVQRVEQSRPYQLDFGRYKGKTLQCLERGSVVDRNYLVWLAKQGGCSENRPELKKALELLEKSRKSEQVQNMAFRGDIRGPQSALSANSSSLFSTHHSQDSTLPADIKLAWEYTLHFGTHDGRKLWDVPGSYIEWLNGQDWKDNPGLQTALLVLSKATSGSETSPTDKQSLSSWIPPDLSIAPTKFSFAGIEPYEIGRWDAIKYFDLDHVMLKQVPNINSKAGAMSRYWLYHVWDFVKNRRSEGIATRNTDRYLAEERRRGQEGWGLNHKEYVSRFGWEAVQLEVE